MKPPPRLDLLLVALRIDTEDVGEVSTLHLSGELDSFTAPELRSALSDELTTRPEVLAVDLTELRFLGVGGLEALLRARQVAARTGAALILTGYAKPSVRRLLDLVGWEVTTCAGSLARVCALDPSGPSAGERRTRMRGRARGRRLEPTAAPGQAG